MFPLSLLTIPLATPDMPMPVILGLILASEFGAGLGVMILDINIGSINNARIPDLLRARANGAYRFINYGVRPVGAILGGLLGTAIGVREALFVSAVAASLGVFWMIGSPDGARLSADTEPSLTVASSCDLSSSKPVPCMSAAPG